MSIYAFDRGKGNFTTKYIFQFARILAFCFLGEILHVVLPLPVPASVYGLVLLLAALNFKLVKLDDVKEVGTYLTGIFPLLFPSSTLICSRRPVRSPGSFCHASPATRPMAPAPSVMSGLMA